MVNLMPTKKQRDQHYKYDLARKRMTGDRKGTCGKICYISRKKADAAVKATLTSGREQSTKTTTFESYFCEKCNAYHTGHKGARYESVNVGVRVCERTSSVFLQTE